MGLDSVEILMKVENTFGISIPDEEAETIVTVGDFHNIIWKNLTASEGSSRQEMEAVINQIIADMAGLAIEEVTSDKKLGNDLGID